MSLDEAISLYSSANTSEAYAHAFSQFDGLVKQNPANTAEVYTHWGVALSNNFKLKDVSEEDSATLFEAAQQKFEAALASSSSTEHVTLLHWGHLLLAKGRKLKAEGKNDLALDQFSQANTKFSESFSKQQTHVDALKAWRESLVEQSHLSDGNQRFWFEAQVSEKGKWIEKLNNNEPINLPAKVETSPQEKLKKGNTEKEQGNEYFKKSDFTGALRHYHNALNYANGLYGLPPQDNQALNELKLSVYNNMAVVHMKQGKNDKALKDLHSISTLPLLIPLFYFDTIYVLELDANNVKALFRRGKLFCAMGEVDKSRVDLEQAKKLDPTNKEILQEFINLEKKEKEIIAKQKNFYAKMF